MQGATCPLGLSVLPKDTAIWTSGVWDQTTDSLIKRWRGLVGRQAGRYTGHKTLSQTLMLPHFIFGYQNHHPTAFCSRRFSTQHPVTLKLLSVTYTWLLAICEAPHPNYLKHKGSGAPGPAMLAYCSRSDENIVTLHMQTAIWKGHHFAEAFRFTLISYDNASHKSSWSWWHYKKIQ